MQAPAGSQAYVPGAGVMEGLGGELGLGVVVGLGVGPPVPAEGDGELAKGVSGVH